VELVKNYTVTMETCRGVSAILSYLNISSFWGITKNNLMTTPDNVVLPKWFYK
jgi:hypothetical protein